MKFILVAANAALVTSALWPAFVVNLIFKLPS
jgi:hypothetical protein